MSNVSPEAVFDMIDYERKGQISAQQLMQGERWCARKSIVNGSILGLEYAGYRNFNMRVCNLMVSMFDTVSSLCLHVESTSHT